MKTANKILLCVLPIVAGCASTVPAPVEDRGSVHAGDKPAIQATAGAATEARGALYTVKKGDTLYSIALDNGQDYKDIAAWNNLENPNVIRIGQQLRVTPADDGSPVAVVKPVASSAPVEVKPVAGPAGSSAGSSNLKREPKGGKLAWSEEALARARQEGVARPVEARQEVRPVESKPEEKPAEKPAPAGDEVEWVWPVQGKPMASFAEGGKGIDIAGKAGDPVVAAAAGVVSYAGAGLRGYGNLVVLRHNATYLSVYAHNSKLLVKEKDSVARGQKIAEMGSTDAESPRLHFEIRRQGKPADPQKFLPPR